MTLKINICFADNRHYKEIKKITVQQTTLFNSQNKVHATTSAHIIQHIVNYLPLVNRTRLHSQCFNRTDFARLGFNSQQLLAGNSLHKTI